MRAKGVRATGDHAYRLQCVLCHLAESKVTGCGCGAEWSDDPLPVARGEATQQPLLVPPCVEAAHEGVVVNHACGSMQKDAGTCTRAAATTRCLTAQCQCCVQGLTTIDGAPGNCRTTDSRACCCPDWVPLTQAAATQVQLYLPCKRSPAGMQWGGFSVNALATRCHARDCADCTCPGISKQAAHPFLPP